MRIILVKVAVCGLIISFAESTLPVLASSDSSEQFVTSNWSMIPENCRMGGTEHYTINEALDSAIPDEDIYPDIRGPIDKTGAVIHLNEYNCVSGLALTNKAILSLDKKIEPKELPEEFAQLESEEMPSDQDESKDDSLNPVLAAIGLTFGLIVVDEVFEQLAEGMADNPNNWGTFYGLFGVPYAISELASEFPDSEMAPWIAGGFTAAFAAYLMNLDEDKYNEDEIAEKIKDAMWAYILTTTTAFTLYWVVDENKKKEVSSFMEIRPTPYGAEARLVYQF